jgi:hypothetical protein
MTLPRSFTTGDTGLPGVTDGAFKDFLAAGRAAFLGDAVTRGLAFAAALTFAGLAFLAGADLVAAGFATGLAAGLAAGLATLAAMRLATDFLG